MDADSHPHAASRTADAHSASGVALVRGLLAALAIAVVAAVAASVSPLLAQPAPATVEVTGVQLEGDTLSASVAVLDAASNPVTGLERNAFTVQVDGVAVQGATVASGVDAALPLGIILTIDTSGSMAGESIESSKQAIDPLVNALQATDQAALLTFANSVVEAVPLTSDKAMLASAISAMVAEGNTALFAAVVRASEVAAAAPQPRRAVVLLSDGEDFGAVSGVSGEQALAAARAGGVPYFVVGLGQDVDQPFLTSLASATGGQYFAAADPAQLAQLYARISDRLRQQYTVTFALPEGLAGGDHRLTVAVGGVSDNGTFTTDAAPEAPALNVTEVPAVLDQEIRLAAAGVPTGSTLRYELNGEPLQPTANGREVVIDPYDLEPGREYTLVIRTEPDTVLPVERRFTVAELPPLLLAPREIPNLRPGDLIRLTVRAQPGDVAARLLVDGGEVASSNAAPFELVVPEEDYGPGRHDVTVVVESAAGSDSATYAFEGPAAPRTNYAAWILAVLAAMAVLALLVYGARRGFTWYRNRPEPLDVTGVGDQLASWSEMRRGKGDVEPEAPAFAAATPSTWATLTVLSGPDAGKHFELRDDTELVGRGRFCSVRLTDAAVEEAHFVISRGGRLSASTPKASVTVDAEAIRTVVLNDSSQIAAGATTLVFRLASPAREAAEV